MRSANVFLIYLFLGFFVGCDDDKSGKVNEVDGIWNLRNITGGIAGVDTNFDFGVILWQFRSDTGELLVENRNSEDGYDGLESGTYLFELVTIEGETYLEINSDEVGLYSWSKDIVIIDQNQRSDGSGADGFVLKLER